MKILHRDEHLIAVNKPSGLLVHASRFAGPERESAASLLHERLGIPVFPVHRLDRATSGVLIFAFDSETASKLAGAFRERRARKQYLAIVRGHAPERGRIERALEKMGGTTRNRALTEYERLGTAELPIPVDRYPVTRLSLLSVRPHTGRMHQIRRHLRGIDHPIVGDSVHGDGSINRIVRERFSIRRLFLHALELELEHPGTARSIVLSAPLPREMADVAAALGWEPFLPSSARASPLTSSR